ncbi:MAG: response regulator transcription factor [Mucilaginibacter polytrichastri]|nr:response regulator transcription factor [Mucilaginibacter polytrichastri]
MKPISCIITDDEPFARKGLRSYASKAGLFDLKAECENAFELGDALAQHPVDLLFLDIQMPHLTGIEFLRSYTNPPKVIFTTAYEQYALEGFELDVLDYLLKPIAFERFMKAAFKARDYFGSRNTDVPAEFLFIKADGKLEKVVLADILFIEGMENYLRIHTTTKSLITHSTLKSMLEKLPARQFIQTHKSFIVRQDKISTIDGNTIHIGGHRVPISRQLRETVLEQVVNSGK